MNIKRAKQEIKNSIRAYLQKDEFGEYQIPAIRQRPILLMGAPGIGKTQIMEQIAGECDLALVAYTITHHTRQSAIGLPFIQEKNYGGAVHSVTEYTMSEIIASVYDKMEASGKREGILFLDEINCVSETLAPAMLQFLQCKSFGNQQVPQGWIIVAAGNPPEYNKSVREFDVVTLDRVKVIPVEADFGVWKEYAYQAGIHGSVISYLDIHRENFYRMETTVDGKRFVTARGWQDLSEMIFAYERQGLEMDQEVIIQYLQHPKVAKDFANYLALYYKYKSDYQVDEILQGTIRPGTLNKLKFAPFDEHMEVVSLLLARLSGNFREVFWQDGYVAKLFELLKRFRKRLEQKVYAELSPAEILRELREKEARDMERKIAAGQNEKGKRRQYRKVAAALEEYERMISGGLETDGTASQREQAFQRVSQAFAAETEELEAQTALALEQLEYAFDFMEAAFGESQEMVVFITELSVNQYAMWFIGENDCPRYYRYNKSLLFENQQASIRRQLDEIRGEMNGQ
ncbi:MAG: AAA family ATPase [Lachnospiraceae bacterium]|nr:AAA family ATPase [Lachnospiraceae bacterium]